MFDLGMQELIVIFVVALLVFGPKRLPELSRALGKGVRELKIAMRGVKESFEDVETGIEKGISEATEVKTPEDVETEIEKGISEATEVKTPADEQSGEQPDTREKQGPPETAREENKGKTENG
jgi:sec-independent protein translocase protein TatB